MEFGAQTAWFQECFRQDVYWVSGSWHCCPSMKALPCLSSRVEKEQPKGFLATSKSHHFRLKWSLISEKAFVADVPPSTAISITWFFSAFCSYSYNQGDYGNINQIVLHPLSILRFLWHTIQKSQNDHVRTSPHASRSVEWASWPGIIARASTCPSWRTWDWRDILVLLVWGWKEVLLGGWESTGWEWEKWVKDGWKLMEGLWKREKKSLFCDRKVSFQPPGLLVWCQEATFPNIMQISGTGCSLITHPIPAKDWEFLVNFRFQLKIFHPTAPPYLFNWAVFKPLIGRWFIGAYTVLTHQSTFYTSHHEMTITH